MISQRGKYEIRDNLGLEKEISPHSKHISSLCMFASPYILPHVENIIALWHGSINFLSWPHPHVH
jgi:hypothetical protein